MNVEAFCIDELTAKTLCEHFGLERLPFPKCIPPEHAFPAGQFAAAMARLQQLLATREIGVVVGEAGTGKSTLLSLFLTQVSVSRYRIVDLATPQARPRELYRAIATALGANPSWFGADALKIIDLLTQSYLESHRPNLLIIDECHLLTPAALNELRLLSNVLEKHEPLVCLVLFGQPQLAATLKLPVMTPLVQRIAVWVTLEGMSAEETGRYIDWQLQTAGAHDPEKIFPVEVKNGIYRRAHGIARLINRIAWECLNQACLESAHMVTEELLQDVCKTLEPQLT
jgi:general secretion pathway protein A